jgi:hypothetical protein
LHFSLGSLQVLFIIGKKVKKQKDFLTTRLAVSFPCTIYLGEYVNIC